MVNINVNNNTNIIGAIVANQDQNGNDLGNLILHTNTLTYSDLRNHNNSESNSFGINLSAGLNPNNPTTNPNMLSSKSLIQSLNSNINLIATKNIGSQIKSITELFGQ